MSDAARVTAVFCCAVVLGFMAALPASQPASELYAGPALSIHTGAATMPVARIVHVPLPQALAGTVPEARETELSDDVVVEASSEFSVVAIGALAAAILGGLAHLATRLFAAAPAAALPLLPLADRRAVALAAASGAVDRRQALAAGAAVGASLALGGPALAAATAPADPADIVSPLCDAQRAKELAQQPRQRTASGLEYQEVVEGTGPIPPAGYQIAFNVVGMLPSGRIFSNSVADGKPLDVRVGAGFLVKGLDEGLLTMRAGGIRRLWIPAELSFQAPVRAAPGQPAIPAKQPIVYDVQLLFVPGLEEAGEDATDVFQALL